MRMANQELIDAESRNVLTIGVRSVIKRVAGINNYGNMTRIRDKSNATTVCPACEENEGWDHSLLCEKNKSDKEEVGKELEKKIIKSEQHENAEEEEKIIVQEMLYDTSEFFNSAINFMQINSLSETHIHSE